MSEYTPSWQRRLDSQREQEIRMRFYGSDWREYKPVFFKGIGSMIASAKFVMDKMKAEGMSERDKRMYAELKAMIENSEKRKTIPSGIRNNLYYYDHSFLNK